MLITIFSNKYFLLVSRIVIGFLFILAGATKIADPQSFANSIENFKIFPDFLINITAIVVPWIELISGVLVFLGIAVKETSFIIINLLGIFIVIIIISLFRGLNVDCGCFGTSSGNSIGLVKLIEDLLMLLPAIQVYIFGGGSLAFRDLAINTEL